MKRLATLVIVTAAACATAAQAQSAGKSWSVPKCSKVTGSTAVTFTNDEGATLASVGTNLRGTTYTYGLVTLDRANTLLAAQNRAVYRSTSSGCKWTSIGSVPTVSDGAPVTLSAGAGDRAFAWSDGRPDLARIDGTTITALKSPVDSVVGVAADAANENKVRLGDGASQLWESLDGGASWNPLGAPADPRNGIIYRAAFDPADLDHVLVGTATNGSFVTFDAGRNWTKSSGLSSTDGPVNLFSVVVSPVDHNVVWAMALDLNEADQGVPSGGRHIYRSTDGGVSFAPVADNSADVVLQNGPVMAAHPTNTNVVYFIFGTSFNNYGTDLYRYDQATGQVTKTNNTYDRMTAIAFNPANAAYIYLGLASEGGF